jgi:hypothetical protein
MFRLRQPQTDLSATPFLLERSPRRRLLQVVPVRALAHLAGIHCSKIKQRINRSLRGQLTDEIRRPQKTKHPEYCQSVNRPSTVLVRQTAKASTQQDCYILIDPHVSHQDLIPEKGKRGEKERQRKRKRRAWSSLQQAEPAPNISQARLHCFGFAHRFRDRNDDLARRQCGEVLLADGVL